MYIITSETFIEIDSLQDLEIQDKPILRTRQKSALQLSLLFTFKRCDKFKLKCTSHGGMY